MVYVYKDKIYEINPNGKKPDNYTRVIYTDTSSNKFENYIYEKVAGYILGEKLRRN
jgi:hypothetical protein